MPDGVTAAPRPAATTHGTGHVTASGWLDSASLDALGLLVASVTQMSGFRSAAISVRRGDDLVTVCVEGTEDMAAALLGHGAPVGVIEAEIRRGRALGRFVHVPQVSQDPRLAEWTYVSPPREPGSGVVIGSGRGAGDAWTSADAFLAPLREPGGRLVGLLSIDEPLSERLPTPEQSTVLDRYAEVAERTVLGAVERATLSSRVRLSETARQALRLASSGSDLTVALEESRTLLMEGYRAPFLAIRAYGRPGVPEVGAPPRTHLGASVPTVREAMKRLWDERRLAMLSLDDIDPVWEGLDVGSALAEFAEHDVELVMMVPFGTSSGVHGHVVMGRADARDGWTSDELQSAYDLAADIGQAIDNAQALAREQQISTYKSVLLSTVSHELKNPLGVISGHLELLDGSSDLSAESQFSVSAMARATRRVSRVVDDLLLLARVQDPTAPVASAPVPIGPVVDDALELVRFAAQQRNLRVRVELPDHDVAVLADAEELNRVLSNLLSNAVKYTPRDGAITVSAVDHGTEVELAISDTGLGISEADQARLFEEFFRSTNPRALAQPGTGLGLAICARIVGRHGGRIEVESALGSGSSFRVLLPAAQG